MQQMKMDSVTSWTPRDFEMLKVKKQNLSNPTAPGGLLLPNDCQGSEAGAAAVDPPQGSVWLAAAAAGGPQGSALGGAGAEEGRASIRSSRVVC